MKEGDSRTWVQIFIENDLIFTLLDSRIPFQTKKANVEKDLYIMAWIIKCSCGEENSLFNCGTIKIKK